MEHGYGGIIVGCVGEGQDHWKQGIQRSEIGIQGDECQEDYLCEIEVTESQDRNSVVESHSVGFSREKESIGGLPWWRSG